ncbi:putative E3 ubiquitin-protein ligase RING1a isoform X1 [Eucalyptus grandis]|uniref:putative E3 ubiquitin-protein ligase RING1a isoform X1 n=1 Tax=Eucalyptus grandis TaxID=71139 RepID=UPI00192EB786|nr:putative E3 ubiquitin-protein ligase RING1a isoform X1 [Eucalyptus grandis]
MRARKHLRKASDDDVTRRNDTSNRGEPPQDDHEFQRSSSSRDLGKDGYVQVKLAEIREKVQCPICLGIIRKTSAVMECLHRFCQECIAKHMLLRSNECPACHAHCGRNSLRADPRYDALIEAFYPDVGKSKEENHSKKPGEIFSFMRMVRVEVEGKLVNDLDVDAT